MIFLRLLLTWILNTLALIVTAKIVPGFRIEDLGAAIFAAVVIGIINTFIKPVLLFLTFPITIITLGLFIFVINAIVLYIATAFVPGMKIDSWLSAIGAAIVLSLVSTILSMLTKGIASGKTR